MSAQANGLDKCGMREETYAHTYPFRPPGADRPTAPHKRVGSVLCDVPHASL